MSKMHDKVLVALNKEPRHSPADRWTSWARSITERHERLTARQGFLIMTLAEPVRMFTLINQRWERFALAVFPRIQVSIGPILQALAGRQFRPVPAVQTALAFPRVTALENGSMLSGHGASAISHQPEPRLFATSMASSRLEAAGAQRITRHSPSESGLVAEEGPVLNDFSESPLRALFARMRRRDPGVVLRKLLFENESEAIAQRVFREHLRTEERGRSSMVVRRQATSGAAVEERRVEMESQYASAAKTRAPSWADKPPEVNVEQLTEQVIRRIDHRITAYRERLGRAF
jgi:hypothetical protein